MIWRVRQSQRTDLHFIQCAESLKMPGLQRDAKHAGSGEPICIHSQVPKLVTRIYVFLFLKSHHLDMYGPMTPLTGAVVVTQKSLTSEEAPPRSSPSSVIPSRWLMKVPFNIVDGIVSSASE